MVAVHDRAEIQRKEVAFLELLISGDRMRRRRIHAGSRDSLKRKVVRAEIHHVVVQQRRYLFFGHVPVNVVDQPLKRFLSNALSLNDEFYLLGGLDYTHAPDEVRKP